SRNLRVDRRVKDSVTPADHRFVIVEGIPGERDPRSEVGSRRVQRAVLTVVLIPQAVVEHQRRLDLPGILPKHGSERPRLLVARVPETLFVERWQSLAPGLQGADTGKIRTYRSGESAASGGDRRSGKFQTIAEQNAGQFEEFEAPREESLRGGVVAADEFLKTHFHRMAAAHER